jgi:hypothetical protein
MFHASQEGYCKIQEHYGCIHGNEKMLEIKLNILDDATIMHYAWKG